MAGNRCHLSAMALPIFIDRIIAFIYNSEYHPVRFGGGRKVSFRAGLRFLYSSYLPNTLYRGCYYDFRFDLR